MVSRVSTQGALAAELQLIQRQNRLFDRLNFQVATGKKFQALKDFGNQASQVINLEREIQSRQGYVRSIDLAEHNIRSYDATLTRLIDVTNQILKVAEPLSTRDENFAQITEVTAVNLMVETQTNLNIEIGDRMLYAGTRFGEEPVVDLRGLQLYNASDLGAPNPIETANDIPTFVVDSGGAAVAQSYHSQGPNTTDSQSYTNVALTIADNTKLTYGITATEPAFQNLVESLVRLRSSAQDGLSDAEREQFLTEAANAAITARNQLRQLQSSNGLNLSRLTDQKEQHRDFINISQIALDNITLADDATAAAEISALSAQIQASFATISTRRQLSLVNFLN